MIRNVPFVPCRIIKAVTAGGVSLRARGENYYHESLVMKALCGRSGGEEEKAKKLYTAITDSPNGVMQWIRSHW
jgi:hypothetical protein